MDVTRERFDAAIDLLITMVVEDFAKDRGQDPSDIHPEFLLSRTGQMLRNEKNKFWWDGPTVIEEMFKKEKESLE